MAAKRFACALIGDFDLAVQMRSAPALAMQPAAVTQNTRAHAEILMRNARAAQYGVEPGMTIAQGKALCPDLVTTLPNPKQAEQASRKNLKLLQNLSPYVEEEAPGCYQLDASGLMRLYRDERTLAQRILALLRAQKYTITVGVADTKTAAKVAAEISGPFTFTLIPSGAEKRFLGSRSIDHLDPSDETRWRLHALGLRTAEQIAAISENDLIGRLGSEGKAIATRARGTDYRHFDPDTPTEPLSRTIVLNSPQTGTPLILHHTEQLLSPLFRRLQAEGEACSKAQVVLSLEDRTLRTIQLAVDTPSHSLPIFIRQLGHALERLTLSARITDITVTVTETRAAPSEQFDLVGGSPQRLTADPGWLATLAVRAEATFYTTDTCSGILPEHHARLIELTAPRTQRKSPLAEATAVAYAIQPICGLRLLAPPRRTEVALEDDRPHTVVIARHRETVARCEGPWELSGNWWESEFDRRYYEIETMRHHRYLIYRDRLSSGWYLQGIFD